MFPTNSVVAIYRNRDQVERAVKELQKFDIDIQKLSIVGKGYATGDDTIAYFNAVVPGVGAVLVSGPLMSYIVGALEDAIAVGGVAVIGAGLCSLGIPKNSAVYYESALKLGRFLLAAHGEAAEVTRAWDIIKITGPSEINTHSSTEVQAIGA